MSSQRDVKDRIDSVKNIRQITRAMEMVAAARLRRAEQRIHALRPYADALRRMTRQAAEAADNVPNIPILSEREEQRTVGLLLVTGDRGLAGAFNSQILRAGTRAAAEHEAESRRVVWYASGRRGVSSLTFRGLDVVGAYTGFTDRPAFADARAIASDLMSRVRGREGRPGRDLLQRLHLAALPGGAARDPAPASAGLDPRRGRGGRVRRRRPGALVEYEPDPEEILKRLVPDYVEISIFRALLESTASEHGARMTAMRSASENAGELIDDLTLEMNRARQAEITQEIMEVVAGAEALT